MVAIVDYGVGNLFSLQSSFAAIGAEVTVTADEAVLRQADRIILPGVGAFEDAAAKLRASGLAEVLTELAAAGKPLMGICLGMQLLFEKSFEFKETEGLGFLSGQVEKMQFDGLKIPHMGWNSLTFTRESPFENDITKKPFCYFVHSYKANTSDENIIAYTEYGSKVPALVGNGIVFGAQYHPEKSGDTGLKMLSNFYDWINNEL